MNSRFVYALVLMSGIVFGGCTSADGLRGDEAFIVVDSKVLEVQSESCQVEVKVNSNRSWSLVTADACDWIEVSQTEKINLSNQSEETVLKIAVSENQWIEKREVELLFLAGSVSETVTLTQDEYVERNRVQVEVPVNSNRIVDPGVFSSLGGSRQFNVIANCNWFASVSDESTATGISLSTSSGFGNHEGFTVTVDGVNTDLDNDKKIVINFVPEGQPPYKYEMIQRKGSILTIEARNMDNTSSVWPFDEDAGMIGSGTLHIGVYGFNYYCSTYNQLHSSGGWQFGTGSDNYVEFPAIKGKRLSRVTFYDYNESARPYMADVSGRIIEGGEPKTYSKKTRVDFKLSGTAPDTPYRIYIGTDKTFRFWLVEIEYVK